MSYLGSSFDEAIKDQLEICKNMLEVKGNEYSNPGDRFHNFNVAAEVQGCTPIEAVAGMMAKHTVSVYDLCRKGVGPYTSMQHIAEDIDMWEEKITDHINYLLVLKALVMHTASKELNKFPDKETDF